MNFYNYFETKIKNKAVVILGLGKEGSSTLRLILKTGGYKSLAIADLNEQNLDFLYNIKDESNKLTKETLDKSLKEIKAYYGKDYQNALNDYDIIFKAPGVVLEKWVNINKISSSMQVFCEYYKNQIIGITGTKGKSTTSSLLFHVLKENGFSCLLAGNIGIPVFNILDDIKKDTVIILEMSCHQLEYMSVSPKIAILLNLHEEHLDHYESYQAYCMAKYQIFKNMDKNSCFISCIDAKQERLPEMISSTFISYVKDRKDTDIKVDENGFNYHNRYFPVPNNLPIIGIHNIYNIAAIYPIMETFHIEFDSFIHSIHSFRPLPHRLEFIGNFHNIDFYDDSISTMGTSTINAVNGVKNTASVLIGGMDRGIDYSDLIDFMIKNPNYIYILMEATGKRIYDELKVKNKITDNIFLVDHLEAAVKAAFKLTPKKKACILSPAAASYGIFRNFEHRGEVFQALVNSET